MSRLQEYVEMIGDLGRNKRNGQYAPHKPCLLLAIIQLIEQGDVFENKIRLSNYLKAAFTRYIAQIPGWKTTIHNPFYYLKNDGFWHLHPNAGHTDRLNSFRESGRSPSSPRQLHELVDYGYFDDTLFNFFTQPDKREIIRQTIIGKYFSEYRQAIENVIAEEHQIGEGRQILIRDAEHPFSYPTGPEPIEENPIRGTAFRREIMRVYNYTCAVCRLRVVTVDGESVTVTDAAHIIPFSVSYSDDIRNGLSLCKLHHWAFDQGLISLSERYTVRVSELIFEEGPAEQKFSNLHNKDIFLPQHRMLYPAQEALAWHREKVFRK